jgi:hypothetical protein
MEPLISNWPSVFLQQLTSASKLSHSAGDSNERSIVGEMVMAASEWYQLAEEALFIQKVLSVLDESAQKAVAPIVKDRLAKMFKGSCNRLLELEVVIGRGDAQRLLQGAQALWDQGEAFTKKLGEGVTDTRS